MEKKYFVLYERDISGESMKIAKGRMIYDRIKKFETREKAIAFGLSNLQDTPIVAKKVDSLDEYNQNASYVVAAYFKQKYHHYCYDGSSDPVPTHEVLMCNQKTLDKVMEDLLSGNPDKLYLGIEEKLTPTALDRVASVNTNRNK